MSSPSGAAADWQLTIREQRREVADVIADNPSLRAHLGELIADAYSKALLAAQRETDLPEQAFPPQCPWSFEQAMAEDAATGE